MRRARHITLPADAEAILEVVSGGELGASGYVAELVRDADRDWRTALGLLLQVGWSGLELRSACAALNGCRGDPADALEWNGPASVDEVRWGDLVAEVRGRPAVAVAIVALAREFWRYNPAVPKAMEDA